MGDSYLKLYRISIGSGSIWDPVHPKMQEWHHCLAAAGYSFCSTGGRQLSPRPAQCGFGGLVHCTQLLHFSSRIGVPSPKGLCHDRQDGEPLSPALLLCSIHFPLKGVGQGMTRQITCTWHSVVLEGGDNSDIQSGILAPCSVPGQDISWPAIIARRRNRPSLTGPRPAATAVSNNASLRLV